VDQVRPRHADPADETRRDENLDQDLDPVGDGEIEREKRGELGGFGEALGEDAGVEVLRQECGDHHSESRENEPAGER